MKLYKLTDQNGQTYGKTQWGPNITHTTDGSGSLCGPGYLHAYTDPLLAVLLNPIHAGFTAPQLWEAEGEISKDDNGLKCGTTRLTTIRQLELPAISTEQRVRFAIGAASKVYTDAAWLAWANDWLSGDKTGAARAAGAAGAAEAAGAARAAWAAWAAGAARAARAAWAAEAAWAARAARAAEAARAARAAWAAEAAWAARAAWAAAWAAAPINLAQIAQWAMTTDDLAALDRL